MWIDGSSYRPWRSSLSIGCSSPTAWSGRVPRPCSTGIGVFLLLLLTAAACAPTGPSRLNMEFKIARRANHDYPVKLDVLVVYEPELMDDLEKLSAGEWFRQREGHMRNNPGMTSFGAWSYEWAPGQVVEPLVLRLPGRPAQGLIFADFLSRGKHAARFDPTLAHSVVLLDDAFRLVPGLANEPESRSWRPPVGWSCVALGAVGVGLGTFFAISAANDAAKTADLTPRQQDEYQTLADSVEVSQTRMWVSYGIGGALIVTGALILLWPEDDESKFRPVPTGDGGSVRLLEW